MAQANGRFVFDTSEWADKLAVMPERLNRAVAATMRFEAPHVQDYMRQNASWQDRTGNARNGLFAQPFSRGKVHGIVAYHTMPYGFWLEVRWNGRYSIIMPTIRVMGKEVMSTLNKIMERM